MTIAVNRNQICLRKAMHGNPISLSLSLSLSIYIYIHIHTDLYIHTHTHIDVDMNIDVDIDTGTDIDIDAYIDIDVDMDIDRAPVQFVFKRQSDHGFGGLVKHRQPARKPVPGLQLRLALRGHTGLRGC